MSQRISLLIHDLRLGQKSKQINNFTRNTGGGNSHGCEGWEATSGFFEASFRLILGCYNASDCLGTSLRVVLGVVSAKLQITTLRGRLACPAAPSQDLFRAHTPKGNRASAHNCLAKGDGACLCGFGALLSLPAAPLVSFLQLSVTVWLTTGGKNIHFYSHFLIEHFLLLLARLATGHI